MKTLKNDLRSRDTSGIDRGRSSPGTSALSSTIHAQESYPGEKKPLIFVWLDHNELKDREEAFNNRNQKLQRQLNTYVPIEIPRKGCLLLVPFH
jgi:hypothetical protein